MSDNLAPWRSHLAHALHRNRAKPYSRYVQLATIDSQGLPNNRTIVFRGFLANSDRLQFITDTRSEKYQHLINQPWGEICWYFTKTREQFRLAGEFTLVTAASADSDLLKARRIMWQNLSNSARIQFAWSDPKQPRDESDSFEPDPPLETEPLANFCLLLLSTQQLDHLELRGEPQNRHLYRLQPDSTWQVSEVNP